ncbi:aldo-keto reductase family 1-like protein [Sarcoptes scabiei]|uniref:Aldo-keto reductase family 1-like protein n=1 Tax=Sarcoptes scabiei TaxID=52283 RepID=A0A132A793_SARSC|nr:aldo-keto reductase family 1-like protein [Sarcoptes scabiei]
MEKKKEIFLKKTPDPGQLFDCLYFQGTEHENIHMKYRNIGKNGLRVPILAFSAWSNFSHVPEHIAGSIIEAALENGVNYFDTGDSFEQGQAETLLGTVLKKGNWPRSSYILSTKIFWKTGPSAHRGAGLSRKFIIEAVEASLRRLQTKYIDILIIHKLDAMCPMEEIVRTMSYLINNGIIFYWGTSRFSPMHIAEAFLTARQFNCPPPICEQMEYHMFTRDKMELQMLELFHKSGIGCITWSPISLQNDDGIHLIIRKQTNDYHHKLTELKKLCENLHCDLTQLSLEFTKKNPNPFYTLLIAWCLQNENVNCILITATSLHEFYLKLNSIKIYPILTDQVNSEIEAILENNPVIKRLQPKTPSIAIDVVTEPDMVLDQ